MDQLDFLTEDEMITIFHRKKTEVSCIEEPQTFLNQLRDHNLVPDDLYKKVIKVKSKPIRRKGVYDILEWIENNRRGRIKEFWSCMFKDHIQQEYPIFRSLQKSVLEGFFRMDENVSNTEKPSRNTDVEKEREKKEGGKSATKRKKSPKDGQEPGCSSGNNQKKAKKIPDFFFRMNENVSNTEKQSRNMDVEKERKKKEGGESATKRKKSPEDGKEPGCSSGTNQKKAKKIPGSSPVDREVLHVTCGHKKGTLYPVKFSRAVRCIQSEGRWFTPPNFERFSGREKSRNWKLSIHCENTTLDQLLKEGRLQRPRRQFKKSKSKKKRKRSFGGVSKLQPSLIYT